MNWIKTLIAKIAAKKVAKALDLKEGNPMEGTVKWYRSKGVLTGIVTVLIGTYEAVSMALAPQMGWTLPSIPPLVFTILGGLGIYSRISATATISK